MTIKEVKEMYDKQYKDVEVYEPNSSGKYYPNHFHTDNCKCVDEYTDESEVGLYELMDEEDYNNSIMANSSEYADFEEWYDNKDAKVLCIMLADINENSVDYNKLFSELQKDCVVNNCCNAFANITLGELKELNYLLDRLLVFYENIDYDALEDYECGDEIHKLYLLVDTLFSRDLS